MGSTPEEPRPVFTIPSHGQSADGMMNRRDFHRHVVGIASVAALDPGSLRGLMPGTAERRRQVGLQVDGARLSENLQSLAAIGRTPDGAAMRVAYSEADLEARQFVTELMRKAGLAPSVDLAGNIIGRRDGTVSGLAPLMLGSHIDSVPQGGHYDGPVGTLAAVEVAYLLEENAIQTRHPLEVVVFQNEEGGKTGSRALIGEVRTAELDLETASGRTIREGIRLLGGDPDRLDEAQRPPGDIVGFLELHVEQGAVLDRTGTEIGVVEGIVGIRRWAVTVTGAANHAGTTPMDQRRDALLAAAGFVQEVNRVARAVPGSHVATVGRIEAFPGAPNVIPGQVRLSLEIRALTMDRIAELFELMRREAERLGEETGTSFDLEGFYESHAAPTDERMRRLVEAAAEELGLSRRRMPSGAGHDAQSMARLAPVGMIFIPSVGGISHSPEEYSRPEHIEAGANVLLRTLLGADETLP